MLCGNVLDQLLNQDCLTYTGTAKQTDLSTFLVRAEEINDLDTCLKDLCLCGLFLKARGFAVDRELFLRLRSFFIVDRLSQNIENSSKCLLTDRHHDRSTGRNGIHAADKTVGGTESDASYRIITEMLGNLNREDPAILCGDLNGVIDLRQPALGKFDIQNGTDDLSNFTNVFLSISLLLVSIITIQPLRPAVKIYPSTLCRLISVSCMLSITSSTASTQVCQIITHISF